MQAQADERDRQGKALQRWEAQKVEWAKVQRNLARRSSEGDPNATLLGRIHHFRQQQERLGMIDVSVPAEVKNGVSAWEMNLRAGTGGCRYVQVGSSFPYPLYCPIRDAESVKPDNHVLMRVIPSTEPPKAHKPVSEGEYFKSRQQEFRKHIKKKFSHYTDSEFFGIEGSAPPLRSDAPVDERPPSQPWQFVPFTPTAQSPTETAPDKSQKQPSRPLSAVTASQKPTTSAEGPMLIFSTSQLNFIATPNEAVQATVRIDNTGSTAVFYSWIHCESEPDSYSNSANFRLSDCPNGVLLPEEEKFCTFAFRSNVAGVFSQQFEFLTVPAGRERIVITLRGVVPTADSATDFEAAPDNGSSTIGCRSILTDVINAPSDNVFDVKAAEMAVRERESEAEAAALRDIESLNRHRQLWEESNPQYPFHPEIDALIAQLYANLLAFLELPQVEWNRNIQNFSEQLSSCCSDPTARGATLGCLNTLLTLAASSVDGANFNGLLWSSCANAAFSECADRMTLASTTARDLVEGKPLLKQRLADKQDKKPGGKKAAPDKKAETSNTTKPQLVDNESKGEYEALFTTLSRRLVVDAIDNMIDSYEHNKDSVLQLCRSERPFTTLFPRPCSLAEEPEFEVVMDVAQKKGKK